MSFDPSSLLIPLLLIMMGLLSIIVNILIAIAGIIIARRSYVLMLVFGLSLVINSGFVYYLMTLQILGTRGTCAVIALCVLVIAACSITHKMHHTGLLLTTIVFQGLCLLGFATILYLESHV